MSGVNVVPAEFLGLTADRKIGSAILEFDLKDSGRVAVVLTQDGLQSLYHHILYEADQGHLAFALQSENGRR